MPMKLSLAALALAAAMTSGLAAPQTPAAPTLDTVDQVLDRYVKAVGGAALQKVTSLTARGTLEITELSMKGSVEIHQKAPNKTLQIVTLDQMGVQREGFDGTIGWAQDPQNGVREKSGVELAEARRAAMFPRELRLKEQYPKMAVTGRETVGARDAFIVTATPAEGEPLRMYFDVQSGLLVRQIATRHGPAGPTQVDVAFEDYRAVDGVQRAHVIRQVAPQFTAVIRISEIRHNVAIDDAIFRKPGSPLR
jgi:hypothetical protein